MQKTLILLFISNCGAYSLQSIDIYNRYNNIIIKERMHIVSLDISDFSHKAFVDPFSLYIYISKYKHEFCYNLQYII